MKLTLCGINWVRNIGVLIKSKFIVLFRFFHFYHFQTELMEFKKKQEEEARTRAHQNEQRRYDAKMREYTLILIWKGSKIAGIHDLEDNCNEDP